MTETLILPIHDIKRLDALQPRTALTSVRVDDYAELLRDGIDLDPVDVFRVDGHGDLLAHGYHRYEAHLRADRQEIAVTLHIGTYEEAVLFACGANAKNGWPLSAADRERVITMLLKHPEVQAEKWSDGKTARHCGVSRQTVQRTRQKQIALGYLLERPVMVQRRNAEPYELRPLVPRTPTHDSFHLLSGHANPVLDLDDVNDEIRSPKPTPRSTTYGAGQQNLSRSREESARPHLPVSDQELATVQSVQIALSWSYIDEQNQLRSGAGGLNQLHELPLAVRVALQRKLGRN